MKFNPKILIFIILILFIAGIYFLVTSTIGNNYLYSWQNEGIQFNSNIVSSLKDANYLENSTFLISPAMTPYSSQQNTNYSNDFLIPFLVVLSGNDKNAVTFIRVYDANGSLSYCSSNFGNVKDETQLPAAECIAMLQNPSLIKLMLEPANAAQKYSEIILEKDSIIIKPNHFSDLKKIFILISKELLPNYANIIKNSNILSSYVK